MSQFKGATKLKPKIIVHLKNRWKLNQYSEYFKLLFLNNYTLWHIKLTSICMYKIEFTSHIRRGSRAAVTSKMECFVIIANGFKPLTVITWHSILDVAASLDPPLHIIFWPHTYHFFYIFIKLEQNYGGQMALT